MNPFAAFSRHAKSRGYTEAIVGDHAYSKRRTPHSPFLRLVGAKVRLGKPLTLVIYDSKKGMRYDFEP